MKETNLPKFDWIRSDGKDIGHSKNEFGIQTEPKSPRIIESYTVRYLKSK